MKRGHWLRCIETQISPWCVLDQFQLHWTYISQALDNTILPPFFWSVELRNPGPSECSGISWLTFLKFWSSYQVTIQYTSNPWLFSNYLSFFCPFLDFYLPNYPIHIQFFNSCFALTLILYFWVWGMQLTAISYSIISYDKSNILLSAWCVYMPERQIRKDEKEGKKRRPQTKQQTKW